MFRVTYSLQYRPFQGSWLLTERPRHTVPDRAAAATRPSKNKPRGVLSDVLLFPPFLMEFNKNVYFYVFFKIMMIVLKSCNYDSLKIL